MAAEGLRRLIPRLARRKGFASAVIAMSILACVAITTTLAVLDSIVLHPVRFPDPDALVRVLEEKAGQAAGFAWPTMVPTFERWQEHSEAAALAARTTSMRKVARWSDFADVLATQQMSPNFFEVLGVRPVAGSFHVPGGNERVAFVSEGLAAGARHRPPVQVGVLMTLDNEPHTIVGVFPDAIRRDAWVSGADVITWLPGSLEERSQRTLTVIGRLRPGATVEQLRAQVGASSKRLTEEDRTTYSGWSPRVTRLQEEEREVTASAATFVVLVSCIVCVLSIVNIVSLVRVRLTHTLGDVILRRALGAGTLNAMLPTIAEIGFLLLLAGAVSVVLAHWPVTLLRALADNRVAPVFVGVQASLSPVLIALGVNGGILGCAFLTLRSMTRHASLNMQIASNGDRHSRFGVFVMVQAAVAVALAICAGQLAMSLFRLQQVPLGFEPAGLVTARLRLMNPAGALPATLRRFESELGRIPGVEGVCLASTLPFTGAGTGNYLAAAPSGGSVVRELNASTSLVSANCFRVLRIPILRGRAFDSSDNGSAAPVVVMSNTLAAKVWPANPQPLERLVRVLRPMQASAISVPERDRRLVGIVGAVRHYSATQPPTDELYVPIDQRPVPTVVIALRTDGDPNLVTESLRQAVGEVDPTAHVYDILSMSRRLEQHFATPRVYASIAMFLFGLALLIAVTGIYSVTAYVTSRRRRELAVRVALGSSPGRIRWLVLLGPLRHGIVGGVAGTALAFVATRTMSRLLFGIGPIDVLTLTLAGFASVVVMVLASVPVALLASRTHPMAALRDQ